jgi:hypothetical protein
MYNIKTGTAAIKENIIKRILTRSTTMNGQRSELYDLLQVSQSFFILSINLYFLLNFFLQYIDPQKTSSCTTSPPP